MNDIMCGRTHEKTVPTSRLLSKRKRHIVFRGVLPCEISEKKKNINQQDQLFVTKRGCVCV